MTRLRTTCELWSRLLLQPHLYQCKVLDLKLHHSYKNGERGQTYNYTRVFPETTSQMEYFEATAGPMVRTQPDGAAMALYPLERWPIVAGVRLQLHILLHPRRSRSC